MTHARFAIQPDLGARLREERRAIKLSQRALAGLIGVTNLTILAYERGTSPITAPTLHKLADAGVDVYY
ncbi:MAG: helix-turn-helix transcriptional regulator [Rhodocyclaceae bacterium]|nr:helix-turn-helix transcriptional regulator [Rhodocyclaceae bacterium]